MSPVVVQAERFFPVHRPRTAQNVSSGLSGPIDVEVPASQTDRAHALCERKSPLNSIMLASDWPLETVEQIATERFSNRLWAVETLGQQRAIEFTRSWCQSLLWTSLVAIVVFLEWQLIVAEPLWPPIVSGLTLCFVCFIGGLGVGTNAAAAYMRELHRVNKMVADRNQELQAANRNLLRQSPEISSIVLREGFCQPSASWDLTPSLN